MAQSIWRCGLSGLLIDTDVLIDALRGVESTRRFLLNQRRQGNQLWISTITLTELYCAKSLENPDEERRLRRFLHTFRVVFIDGRIAIQAGMIVRQYNCAVPDALIAACAEIRGLTLVTRNVAHFRDIENLSLQVFED